MICALVGSAAIVGVLARSRKIVKRDDGCISLLVFLRNIVLKKPKFRKRL